MFPIIKGCWHVGQRSICCSTWQCSSKSLSMLSPFLAFCKSHGLTNESKQKMSHSYIPWMSHVVLVLIELLCKFWIRYGNQWVEIACENPKMKKYTLWIFQQRNQLVFCLLWEQIVLKRTIYSSDERSEQVFETNTLRLVTRGFQYIYLLTYIRTIT